MSSHSHSLDKASRFRRLSLPVKSLAGASTDAGMDEDRSGESTSADTKSKANYGLVRNKLLAFTPELYKCKLFCGGASCKYCNPSLDAALDCAIPGLYSTWITEEILASARPQQSDVQNNDLIQNLKNAGISSIINLQHSGEHDLCGQGILPSGFSYEAEQFMEANVFHYNFGWPDFGVAPVTTLINMVKVTQFAASQGKVLIHCHAGLGRTGVLICCYLIWKDKLTPKAAIDLVRSKRPKSVQTKDQVDVVYQFSNYLKPICLIYRNSSSVAQYCADQKITLHGYEERVLKYIPKIIYVILERLLELADLKPKGNLEQKLDKFASGDEVYYEMICLNKERPNPISILNESHLKDCDPTESLSRSHKKAKHTLSKAFSSLQVTGDPNKKVIDAIIDFDIDKCDDTLKVQAKHLQESLDSSQKSWKLLSYETDYQILLILLFDWFRLIEEPMLPTDATPNANKTSLLRTASKESEETLLFMIQCFSCFGNSISHRCKVSNLLCSMVCRKNEAKHMQQLIQAFLTTTI